MKKMLSFMLVTIVLALCLSACGDNEGTQSTSAATTTTTTRLTTKGAESFEEAFIMRGVEHTLYEFSTPNSAAFASHQTDETVNVIEFGYDGEVISEFVKTFYMNVAQYDASQRESIKQSMEDNFADAEKISGVTVTHALAGDHYILRVEIKGLDSVSRVDEVTAAGIFDFTNEENLDFTVSGVENTLLANEYIKK